VTDAQRIEQKDRTRFVTHAFLKTAAGTLCKALRPVVVTMIKKEIDPLATRLATLETRTGALTMLASKGTSSGIATIENLEGLLKRVATLEARCAELERQAKSNI
jgi:hypothetical protein